MAKFAYNNEKNTSIGYTLFKPNYGYYPYISDKENIDLQSKSKSANQLLSKLPDFMTV